MDPKSDSFSPKKVMQWITSVCFSVGKAEEGCLQEDVRAGVKTKKGLFRRKDRRDQTFSQGTEEIKYERENVDSH